MNKARKSGPNRNGGYNTTCDGLRKTIRSFDWESEKEAFDRVFHINDWRRAFDGFWQRRGIAEPVVSPFIYENLRAPIKAASLRNNSMLLSRALQEQP